MREKMTIVLKMTPSEASAVADALSYFGMASADNFGAGYDDDREAKRNHAKVDKVLIRLTRAVLKDMRSTR